MNRGEIAALFVTIQNAAPELFEKMVADLAVINPKIRMLMERKNE
jgi:hypothetical protein